MDSLHSSSRYACRLPPIVSSPDAIFTRAHKAAATVFRSNSVEQEKFSYIFPQKKKKNNSHLNTVVFVCDIQNENTFLKKPNPSLSAQ